MYGLGSLYHLGKAAVAAIKGDEDEMLNEVHKAEEALSRWPFGGFGSD